MAGDGPLHDVGLHPAAVGVGYRECFARRRCVVRQRDGYLQRCVGHALHLLVDGLCHRAQGVGGLGSQQQVALDDQGVCSGLIGRVEHAHIIICLLDLHFVDGGGGVIFVGQRAGVVARLRLGKGPDLTVRRRQQLAGQVQRRPLAARPRPDARPGMVSVPGKLQLSCGRCPQEGAGRLRHPGQHLPASQVVAVERRYRVVGAAGQLGVGNLNIAPLCYPLGERPNGHWEIALDGPQPCGLDAVQLAHDIVSIYFVGIPGLLGGLDGPKGTHQGAGARGVLAVVPQAGTGGNNQRSARLHPDRDLDFGGTSRAGRKVRRAGDHGSVRQAHDGVLPDIPGDDLAAVIQHQHIFEHGQHSLISREKSRHTPRLSRSRAAPQLAQ